MGREARIPGRSRIPPDRLDARDKGLPPPLSPVLGSGGMPDLKSRYREELRAARRRLSRAVAAAATGSIASKLIALPVFQACRDLLLYSASACEVGTTALRMAAERAGKRVYYPRVPYPGADLEFVRVDPGDRLRAGMWGILEPVGDEVFATGQPALVVVPGLAFDTSGTRLGRGRGCYDRALRRLRPPVEAIGLAFALQVVPQLPRDHWDEPVDVVVTEAEVIQCAAQSGSGSPRATSK